MAGGWALFILAATSVPLPGSGMLDRPLLLFGVEADKVGHAAMYAVLGWLTVGALDAAGVRPARSLMGGLAAAAAFAALDEWHQSWIPTRSPEMVDWVADAAGLVVGAAVRRVRDWTRTSGDGRGRTGPATDRGAAEGQDQREERTTG